MAIIVDSQDNDEMLIQADDDAGCKDPETRKRKSRPPKLGTKSTAKLCGARMSMGAAASVKATEREVDIDGEREEHSSEGPVYLLLRDTTRDAVPLHVKRVLQHTPPNATQGQMLLHAVYVVALESGYSPSSAVDEANKTKLQPVLPVYTFDARNVRRLARAAPPYTSDYSGLCSTLELVPLLDCSPEHSVKLQLTNVTTGDLMIVNFTAGAQTNWPELRGHSVCLPIARFVLAAGAAQRPLHERLQNLDELTQRLRDQVFIPMRNQVHALLQVLPYAGLDGLPAELHEMIFAYLSLNQLNILANVTRQLHVHVCESATYRKYPPKQKWHWCN